MIRFRGKHFVRGINWEVEEKEMGTEERMVDDGKRLTKPVPHSSLEYKHDQGMHTETSGPYFYRSLLYT